MNFAALLGHNSGRATPSLCRTPTAQHNETRNPAGFHLLIARSCSDKPSQLFMSGLQIIYSTTSSERIREKVARCVRGFGSIHGTPTTSVRYVFGSVFLLSPLAQH